MERTGCHKQETFDGKRFIAFIALAIRQTYAWKIQDLLAARKSMTVATSLGEMEKNQVFRKNSGGWRLKYALTKLQKDIYKHFDLTEQDIAEKAAAL